MRCVRRAWLTIVVRSVMLIADKVRCKSNELVWQDDATGYSIWLA